MDICCPKCGEPWDIDSLHDLVDEGDFASFDAARKAFFEKGCGATFGTSSCKKSNDVRASASSALYEMMDDFEFAGLLD